MTDESAQDPPELTPEDEAELTALLRFARAPEPMPQEVALRLDRALAELVASHGGTVPHPTAAQQRNPRRTRSRVPAVLLAAAAVTVAGFGVDAVLHGGGAGDASSSALDVSGAGQSEAGGTARDGDGADPTGPGPTARAPGRATAHQAMPAEGPVGLVDDPPVVIRSGSLRADTVRAVARFDRARAAYVAGTGATAPSARPRPSAPPERMTDRCRPPEPTPGPWFVVKFDGSAASLSTAPADPAPDAGAGATVRVRIRDCSGDLLAATTVPAP